MIYEYDGSFPAFLCACAELLNEESCGLSEKTVPQGSSVVLKNEQRSLFDQRVPIHRDDERAARLWQRLQKRIGQAALRVILEAYLSDYPDKDNCIARMVIRLWNEGPSALQDLSSKEGIGVEKAARRAREEGHRFCGLLRFQELADGSLYGIIKPDCDILVLIADHFSERFNSYSFAIYDEGRQKALVHPSGGPWTISKGFSILGHRPSDPRTTDDHGLPLSNQEREIQNFWRLYFDTIAIEERKNETLQRNKMPKKYWKNLTKKNREGW